VLVLSQVLVSAASLLVLAVFSISILAFLSYVGTGILEAAYYASRLSREQLTGTVYAADPYTYAISVVNTGSEPARIKSSYLELSAGCQGGDTYYRTKIYLGQRILSSGEKWYQAVRLYGADYNGVYTASTTCSSLGRVLQVDGFLTLVTENSASYRFPLQRVGNVIVITKEDIDAGTVQKQLPNGRVVTLYVRSVLACFAAPSSYTYYSYYPSGVELPIAVDIYFGNSMGDAVPMPYLGGQWPPNIRMIYSDFSSNIDAKCTKAIIKNNYQEIMYKVGGSETGLYSGVFFGVVIIVSDIGPGLKIERIDTGLQIPPAEPGVVETYTVYQKAVAGDPPPIIYMLTPEFLLKFQGKKAIFQSFSGILLVGQVFIDQTPTRGQEKKVLMSVQLPILIYLSYEGSR